MAKNIYILDERITSDLNGIGTYVRELISSLRNSGLTICLVSFNSQVNEFCIQEEEGFRKMCFPFLPGSVYSFYPILLSFFRLYIEDNQDTVFMVNHTPCLAFLRELRKIYTLSKVVFVAHGMRWCSLLLGDKEKCKEIYTHKGSWEKAVYEAMIEEECTYRVADKVVVLSTATQTFIQEVLKIPADRLFYAPNGLKDSFVSIDGERQKALRAYMGVGRCEKIVLCVSRVVESKGCFRLIRSFRKVVEAYPECRLVMVGVLPDAARTLQYTSDFACKITFTGQIPPEQVKNWYQIADLGILPSYSEQCSYAGIEMMMYGLPVVASDGFGVTDMFCRGVNAEIAEIGNRTYPEIFENNLAGKIIYLLEHPYIARSLGLASRKKYEAEYTSHRMRQRYKELFLSV